MCMVEETKVVDVRGVCKVQVVAKAPQPTQSKMDDELSILPSGMRKNFLASINRNREAFTALAKL